jgi:hypothetical protein
LYFKNDFDENLFEIASNEVIFLKF